MSRELNFINLSLNQRPAFPAFPAGHNETTTKGILQTLSGEFLILFPSFRFEAVKARTSLRIFLHRQILQTPSEDSLYAWNRLSKTAGQGGDVA